MLKRKQGPDSGPRCSREKREIDRLGWGDFRLPDGKASSALWKGPVGSSKRPGMLGETSEFLSLGAVGFLDIFRRPMVLYNFRRPSFT